MFLFYNDPNNLFRIAARPDSILNLLARLASYNLPGRIANLITEDTYKLLLLLFYIFKVYSY